MNAWKIYFPDKKMALARYHVKFNEDMPSPSPTQPMVFSWKAPSHPFWDTSDAETLGHDSVETESTLRLGHKLQLTSTPDAPPGTTTSVFKLKPDADGTVVRLKARECARGILQVPPIPPAVAPEVSVNPSSGDGGDGATDALVPRQTKNQNWMMDLTSFLLQPKRPVKN